MYETLESVIDKDQNMRQCQDSEGGIKDSGSWVQTICIWIT